MGMLENFEDKMKAYSLKEHRAFRTYYLTLRQNGLTVDDLLEYIEKIKKREPNTITYQYAPRFCPECNSPMRLYPVNINEATQTGDNSKSVWMCYNSQCMHTEYSTKTVQEWTKELKVK